MSKTNLDDVYLLVTQGDKKAQQILFDWFVDKGMSMAVNISKEKCIYSFNREEVYFRLVELFLNVINSFKIGESPFESYSLFLLNKRIQTIVYESCISNQNEIVSLDETNSDGKSYYDLLQSSDYDEMNKSIEKITNSQIIASSNFSSNKKIDQRFKKLLELSEQGYKRREIMNIMHLSDGQYRYLLRMIRNINQGKIRIDLK